MGDPNLTGARARQRKFDKRITLRGRRIADGRTAASSGTFAHQSLLQRQQLSGTLKQSDISYSISVTGTQLIFNGTTFNEIRGTFFQRDSAYFAFRNVLDQLIATVKTQFYQIIVTVTSST